MSTVLRSSRSVPIILGLTLLLAFSENASADDAPARVEPTIPEGVHLEPLNPMQVWKAIAPALAEGRCPELIEQLVAVFTDDNPAQSPSGWYHESETRYGWRWLSSRFDGNHDGTISPAEFDARDRATAWKALDRNADRRLAPDDFDWSARSKWVRDTRRALNRFNELDTDANGRITREEWQRSFRLLSRGKNDLTIEDLRESLIPKPERKRTIHFSFRYRWNRAITVLNGDIGSMFEGPRLNAPAPDFTLLLQDSLAVMSLSQFRNQKPVVLIFGSFT